jgi:hypothetical protein
MIFKAHDHTILATLFNGVRNQDTGELTPYAGYRPTVREAPNGDMRKERCSGCDGRGEWYAPSAVHNERNWERCVKCGGCGFVSFPNVDETKRYLHVAEKYHPPEWARVYLARAHWEACKVADALGVPDAYYPRPENGTLRVLEYPPGAGSAEHKDFNLFTILCYRSHPEDLEVYTTSGMRTLEECERYKAGLAKSPGLHIGEIGELVGLGPATPHRVPARPYAQQSIVYFALPATRNQTVKEWLDERIARSRVYT